MDTFWATAVCTTIPTPISTSWPAAAVVRPPTTTTAAAAAATCIWRQQICRRQSSSAAAISTAIPGGVLGQQQQQQTTKSGPVQQQQYPQQQQQQQQQPHVPAQTHSLSQVAHNYRNYSQLTPNPVRHKLPKAGPSPREALTSLGLLCLSKYQSWITISTLLTHWI